MNWESQLARAVGRSDDSLAPVALRARNLCRQKKYGEALEVFWGILLDARRSDLKHHEAFALIHIGKVYRNWIWDAALKFFKDGLEVSKSCNFKRGEMIAYNAMGELYYAWGYQDKALEYYQKSLETACRLEDASCRRDVLLDMVECYAERGEFELCDELLNEAVEIDEELGVAPMSGDGRHLDLVE